MNERKRNKLIFVGVIGLFAGVIIWVIVLFAIDIMKTGSIEVYVSPESAKIQIGNKTYRNGTYRIEPGEYAVTIEKDGFEKYTGEITVEDGEKADVLVCLIELDGNDWYAAHANDNYICQVIDEGLYEREKIDDNAHNLIPYHSYREGFNADFYQNDDGEESIKIEILSCNAEKQEELKNVAERWLKDNDIEIDEYPVSYDIGC